MKEDELLRHTIGWIDVARHAARRGELQGAVDAIEAARSNLADAVWELERKIAHRELSGDKPITRLKRRVS